MTGCIVFICDDEYVIPVNTAITSLLINKKKSVNYKIYIISNGITEKNRNKLMEFRKSPWNTEMEIIDISLEKYKEIYKEYHGNTGAQSITALGKFDIADIISEEKILYLDGDIIVKKDISELFNFSFSDDKWAYVVIDSGKMYNTSGLRGELPKYFNSGVMLLNLIGWRKNNLREQLVEAKRKLSSPALVDQDAFNIVFRGHTTLLSIGYNALLVNLNNSINKYSIYDLNKLYSTNYSCIYDLEENISIAHFASREKPWIFSDVRYAAEWMEYYKKSPRKDIYLERKNFYEISKDEEKSQRMIPIVLATDENYIPQTYVLMYSILQNNKKNDIRFYILTAIRFSEENLIKFSQLEKRFSNCKIEYKMMENAMSDAYLNIPHITKATYYRLKIPSILPEHRKVIYIDSDAIVENDLIELYQVDMKDYWIAGVLAPSYHSATDKGNLAYCVKNELPAIDQYINAGVLLINLEALRNNNVEKEFLKKSKKKFRSQDQDIINGVCYNHILMLQYKYNCMVAKYEKNPEQLQRVFSVEEVNEAHNRPIIIHYAAEEKPWINLSCPLADRWWKYAKQTPYYEMLWMKSLPEVLRNGVKERFTKYKKNSSQDYKIATYEDIYYFWQLQKMFIYSLNSFPSECIYIYGAGIVGKNVAKYLQKNKICFEGFIVTSPQENAQYIMNKEVRGLNTVLTRIDELLFLTSVKDVDQPTVIQALIRKGAKNIISLNRNFREILGI